MSQPLPVRFTRRAAQQVEDAGLWWHEHRAKVPDAIREELERALQLIASHPNMGARARNAKLTGVRRIVLSRVGYHLYYRLLDAPSRSIQILALWHASRAQGPGL